MMTEVQFLPKDESSIIVACSDWGISQELSEFFSFYVDGYKFMPSYRSGQFDGKIRIFNLRQNTLPKGLLKIAVKFCEDRNYTFSIDPELNPKTNFNEQDIVDWIDSIEVTTKGKSIAVRDYQTQAIIQSLRYYRNLLISPTQCLHPEELIEVDLDEDMINFLKANQITQTRN